MGYRLLYRQNIPERYIYLEPRGLPVAAQVVVVLCLLFTALGDLTKPELVAMADEEVAVVAWLDILILSARFGVAAPIAGVIGFGKAQIRSNHANRFGRWALD